MLDIVMNKLQDIPKALALLFISFFIFIVLYRQTTDLPIAFLVILFFIALVIISFLPSKIEIATITIIIVTGTVSAFISPINDIPDERVHFARALYLSEGHLNLTNDDSKLLVSDDIKLIDYNTGKPLRFHFSLKDKTNDVISFKEIRSTSGYYNFSYMPQAIGLFIGRIFSLTMGWAYFLGRICNVIAYGVLIYLALKLVNQGKQLIAVASLSPMNIYIAGSFNQDSVSIGLIFLTISLFIKMLTDKKVMSYHLILYTILCSLIAFTKLPYILLIFLIMLIPDSKFKYEKYKLVLYKLFSILAVLFITVLWIKLYGQINSPQVEMADFLQKVNIKEQIISIITSPILYGAVLLKHTFLHLFNPAGIQVFGALSYGIVELFPLSMIYYSIVIINNANRIRINKLSRLGISVVTLGIIGGIIFSLYLTFTPVGELTVLGVQDRYFLGIIPLVFVLLSSNNKKFEKAQGILSNKEVLNCSLVFILAMIIRVMLQYYT